MESDTIDVLGYQLETDPRNVPTGPPMMGSTPGNVRPMEPDRRRTPWGAQYVAP